MNQIMPVGRGVLVALERSVRMDEFERFHEAWKSRFPDVPMFAIHNAQIVLQGDQPILIEFTGTDLTETFIAEFRRWWEGVNHG